MAERTSDIIDEIEAFDILKTNGKLAYASPVAKNFESQS